MAKIPPCCLYSQPLARYPNTYSDDEIEDRDRHPHSIDRLLIGILPPYQNESHCLFPQAKPPLLNQYPGKGSKVPHSR